MTLNVENLNKLIAHLEAQPPERFNMVRYFTRNGSGLSVQVGRSSLHTCGTAACIAGHIISLLPAAEHTVFWGSLAGDWLGMNLQQRRALFEPKGFDDAPRWPLWRAISTLKRLRDHYLTTGEFVVDWGPEPGEGQPWAAPKAVETKLTPPALPEEITRLLASTPQEA